jgi:hypothetical protein
MKNGYLKILVNVAIILAILLVMDVLVGWIGEKYMRWLNAEPRDGDAALVNYNVNAVKPDVAILGSSTAICHYDPDMIHDSLLAITGEDLKVFNMGVSNQRLAYDYYGLKCLLDRTTPKIVIVDVWASYIGEGDPSFSFEAFRPYANINPNIKEMLVNHGDYGFMEKSNLYCFNTEFVKLLMSPFKPKGVKGFSKSKATIAEIEKGTEKDTTALSPLSVREFDGIISLAQERGFKLFVVMSPTLRPSDTTSLSYQYIKDKCAESKITFLDYSNDEKYYQTQYFRDKTHLNFYGAEIFTQELLGDIKPYITNNNNY